MNERQCFQCQQTEIGLIYTSWCVTGKGRVGCWLCFPCGKDMQKRFPLILDTLVVGREAELLGAD